jgi:rhodanese-related sulfurtransferase
MADPVPQLAPLELQEKLARKGAAAPLLIDVRNPAETAAEGVIENASLIPLSELQQRLGELPRDREIVCVCKMGMRSFNAAGFLRQQGFAAASLAGGMTAWLGAGLPIKR